jgi:hypothetical protein
MGIPREALELEQRTVGVGAKTRLGEAYELLRNAWRAGDRDRDLGLHLMFLSWYLVIEPAHLTGLDEHRTPSRQMPLLFTEVHDYFAPSMAQDAEMLYVVGLMARLCPWCIGDVTVWDARSDQYRRAYRRLAPTGLAPSIFEGRGFYGDYFAGQCRVAGGY